jgi:hypothetical protein
MIISIEVHTKIGVFKGEPLNVTEEQYAGLLTLSKDFYKQSKEGVGFETRLEDGSFCVIAPEILKESIMVLRKIKDKDEKN